MCDEGFFCLLPHNKQITSWELRAIWLLLSCTWVSLLSKLTCHPRGKHSRSKWTRCENTLDYCCNRSLNQILTADAQCNPHLPPFSLLSSSLLPSPPLSPDLSPQSRVALSAYWQEDELGNLQQPGAGWRPTAPTAVPPEGDAAAGARRGGAASGLQAGGDGQGSPRRLPGSAARLRHGGSEDHATQGAGDRQTAAFPYNDDLCLELQRGRKLSGHLPWEVKLGNLEVGNFLWKYMGINWD